MNGTKPNGGNRPLACLLLLAAALLWPAAASAQWATMGNDINSTNTGNVGVGTAAPTAKLEVLAPSSSAYAFTLSRQGSAAGEAVSLTMFNAPGTSGTTLFPAARLRAGTNGVDSQGSFIEFQPIATNGSGWSAGLTVKAGGSVGIGTTNPSYRLHVAGDNTAAGGYPLLKLQNTQTGGRSWWLYSGAFGVAGALGIYDETAAAYRMFFDTSGNVGMGTTAPSARLQVSGAGGYGAAGAAEFRLNNTVWGGSFAQHVGNTGTWQLADTTTGATKVSMGPGTNGAINFFSGSGNFVVNGTGNVGIGVPTPAHKLDVNGGINATGAITGSSIEAKYQDLAEWVPSGQKLSAGTVVVLDTERSNHVLASTTSYDTKVAGVVSAQPGIALGVGGEGKVLVATTGRVRVKADATRAPIKVGDLLVSGDAEGVAMKSVPADIGGVLIHRPGTIIGKALEPLEKGVGEILVLLSLQ